MFKIFGSIFCVALALTSCSENKNDQKEIYDLKNQVSSLQSQVYQLQNDLNRVSNVVYSIHSVSAGFSPSTKEYSIIRTNNGDFLASLESVNKYADGYKVTFKIGNPSLITYSGVKARVQWGEAEPADNLTEWLRSLKSQEITIDKPLLPGMWNSITVVLSPATAKETGFISLGLTTDEISLYRDARK